MQQQTQEWHELRKSKIGASDAPIIMDVSPWKTQYQLWCEKLGVNPPAQRRDVMRFGLDMEDTIRQRISQEMNTEFVPKVILSSKYEWAISSLDGISSNGISIEIKCANKEDHELAKSGKVPEKYVPQVMHHLACEDYIKFELYVSYYQGDIVNVPVYRDIPYIDNLMDKEREFYRMMQDFIAPPFSEKDYVKRLDNLWMESALEWLEIKSEQKKLDEREKKVRENLIRMCENQNCEGQGIKVSKIIRKGNVDYSTIPELIGIDLDKHRKSPVETWRILECT